MRIVTFWIISATVTFTYVGYPALLWLVSRIRPRPINKGAIEPSLSIIIPAHNEEQILPRKLESILAQGYPISKLEILVGSDGSTDRTVEIAQAFSDRGVRVIRFDRVGKAHVLNELAARAGHEILIFTDANAILAPGMLHVLVSNFADPNVGGVSANERREESDTITPVGRGERMYWEYDKWLKSSESLTGSIVSASGSLYAIRRDLFRPISDPAATDDFTISTQVVRAGKRLVFEEGAITFEPPISKQDIEFSRKVRIVTRGLRSIWGIRELLLPWRGGFYAVQLWSHKILRRLVGVFAVILFGLTLSLRARNIYRAALAAQISLYSLAAAGWIGNARRWGRKPIFYMPYYFCLSNIAATIGVAQFLVQRRLTIWQPRRD